MLDEVYSNRKTLIRTFFQGRFNILPETILIVVSTEVGAERFDRILAQLLKRIITNLNIEADIITDALYYKKKKKYSSKAMICIGERTLVIEYQEKGEFGLKPHETTAEVFVENQRPIAFIYGKGVKETYEATMDFCENKMTIFLDKWSSRFTQGKKSVQVPSNVEELLSEIIFSMSSLPLDVRKENNQKALSETSELKRQLQKHKFALMLTSSAVLAILSFLASYYFRGNFGVSVTIFLAILFGIPAIYAVYPKKKE